MQSLSSRSLVKPVVLSVVLSAALLVGAEGSSRADEPSTGPAPATEAAVPVAPARAIVLYAPPAPKAEWYGWQTLAVDGASLGTLALAGETAGHDSSMSNVLLWSSISGYALGGPIVHAAHGQWGTALADLGLRAGAVAAGAAIGYAVGAASGTEMCGAQPCWVQPPLTGLVLGAAAGVVTASVVDAAVLGRSKPRRDETPAPAVSWTPRSRWCQEGGRAASRGRSDVQAPLPRCCYCAEIAMSCPLESTPDPLVT